MKKIAILTALVLILIFFLVFESCDLLGVSKEQRIDIFLDDINQDPIPDSVRYNFSTSCAIYPTINGVLIRGDFPADSISYNIYSLNLDADPVTGMISGTGDTFGDPIRSNSP